MITDQSVIILQVVDRDGRRVMDPTGNWRLFEVFDDGQFTGTRGTVFSLHKLTGKPLHWRYGLVVCEGEMVRRADLPGTGG